MGDTKKTNGAKNGNGKATSVRRADFAKDPGRYLDQVRDHGPVVVTDARGKPRVMLVVAKPSEPYPID